MPSLENQKCHLTVQLQSAMLLTLEEPHWPAGFGLVSIEAILGQVMTSQWIMVGETWENHYLSLNKTQLS